MGLESRVQRPFTVLGIGPRVQSLLGFLVYRNCIGFGSGVLSETFWAGFVFCFDGLILGVGWAGVGALGLVLLGLEAGRWGLGLGLGLGLRLFGSGVLSDTFCAGFVFCFDGLILGVGWAGVGAGWGRLGLELVLLGLGGGWAGAGAGAGAGLFAGRKT